jgi:hypothetical protein
MRHPGEEELTLYYYGESAEQERVARHLEACGACLEGYQALQRVLAAAAATPVPERGESYEAELWARIAPRLEERRAPWWAGLFQGHRLALAGAVAVLVVAAFVAGRWWPQAPPPDGAAGNEQVRDRIFLVAVGDHLDRSQMVLVELMNADTNGTVDISSAQEWVRNLVADNRLYRQTAAGTEETAVATVLDDLERVLIEIANSPSKITSAELEEIRERIESEGIVFKMRVIGSRVRERERATAQRLASAHSS